MQPNESRRAKIDLRDDGDGCGRCTPVAASSTISVGGNTIVAATAMAPVDAALADNARGTVRLPSDECRRCGASAFRACDATASDGARFADDDEATVSAGHNQL